MAYAVSLPQLIDRALGLYNGYGVRSLPGVREAIEERQYELIEEKEVNATATVLNRLAVQERELSE